MFRLSQPCDYLIIGGGFFGCYLSSYLAGQGKRVIVVEMDDNIMKRASYANQARVHNGYHYPRSLMTALRSRINFPKFCQEFAECIVNDFDKYYAIGKKFSKVSAKQFRRYFEIIGAPLEEVSDNINKLFNPNLVDKVWKVKEYAFDSLKLREIMWERLIDKKVSVFLSTEVIKLLKGQDNKISVMCKKDDEMLQIKADRVINATYSHINQVLVNSALNIIPIKHEITEMALIKLPEELRGISVTVMCGPFFSFMPFPPRSPLYTLSHVRYTPHCYWNESGNNSNDPYRIILEYPKKSNYVRMVKDAARYIPLLAKSEYVDSIWEVKTILPKSEIDDGRPILFLKDYGISGLDIILGGKIDNVYDVIEQYKVEEN